MDIKKMLDDAVKFFKNLPETIKNAPNDEKAAYGAIGLGIFLILLFIILKIIS